MTASERRSERTAATARPTTPAPMTATSTSGWGRGGGIEQVAYFQRPARRAAPRRRIPPPGLRSGGRGRRAEFETGHFHPRLTGGLAGLHDSRHRGGVEGVGPPLHGGGR